MNIASSYRTKVSDSGSDSDDSDKEFNDWKRAPHVFPKTETVEPIKDEPVISKPLPQQNEKRKRNTIWCDVLQDQLISEDLHHCGIKRKPKGYGSRGLESYDYTLRYSDPRVPQAMDDDMAEGDPSEESDTSSVVSSKSKRIGTKYVHLESPSDVAAAMKIINVLQERKKHLIFRVVKYLGVEKAMSLLKMTEQIEENGGMMIMNHARRRTPGGVFIQLLKTDKDISKKTIDQIFEDEMSGFEKKKYFDGKRQKKKHSHKKKRCRPKKPQDSMKLEEEEPSMAEDQAIDIKIDEMDQEPFMIKDEACTSALKTSSDRNLEDGEIEE